MKEDIVTVLVGLAILIGLFFYVNSRYSNCEAKGGAYVQGQCLKVEVIK
jgi:hypothetical protein